MVGLRSVGIAAAVHHGNQFVPFFQCQNSSRFRGCCTEQSIDDQFAQFHRSRTIGHVQGQAVQHGQRLGRSNARSGLSRIGGTACRREIACLSQPFANSKSIPLRFPRLILRRPLRQLPEFFDEYQPSPANADLIQWAKDAFLAEQLPIDQRAIEAAEVPNGPVCPFRVYLGVFPAAKIVLDDDFVGRSAS